MNGQNMGYCSGAEGSEEITYEAIKVLDHIQTVEFVPVGYDATLSASRVRLIGRSIRGPDLTIFPKLGNNDAAHLLNILNMADLVATIEDTITNQIFATYEQCKVTRHNWRIDPRGVVGENIDFVGVRIRDEAESQV